jgi:hypothetical protein
MLFENFILTIAPMQVFAISPKIGCRRTQVYNQHQKYLEQHKYSIGQDIKFTWVEVKITLF